MHSRQKPVLGERGQKKLEKGLVAIVGLGALGSMAAELLARSGVSLLLFDRDLVEESNLQRQLYARREVGKSKAEALKEKIKEIAPEIKMEAHAVQIQNSNLHLLDSADLIIDGTDNLQTRFLLNEYCRKNQKFWIYGAAIREEGYVMPITPSGPCLRCFLREAQLETCAVSGVLNTITVSLAALQVHLVLDYFRGKEMIPQLYHYDLSQKKWRIWKVRKRKECPACLGKYEYLGQREPPVIKFCASGRYQVSGRKKDLARIKKEWKKIGPVEGDGLALRFRNIILFRDGRALIQANSEEEAQSIYSKYVGN